MWDPVRVEMYSAVVVGDGQVEEGLGVAGTSVDYGMEVDILCQGKLPTQSKCQSRGYQSYFNYKFYIHIYDRQYQVKRRGGRWPM